MKKSYKAYAAATQTIAKTKQIILLYDAAIRYIQQAEVAIKEKQIEARYHALDKAAAIIFGLQGCLDFEQGGEIAKTLYSFYSSIDTRILQTQRDNNLETCAQLIKELKMMREAWAEIDAQDEKDNSTAQTSVPTQHTTPESPASGVALSA